MIATFLTMSHTKKVVNIAIEKINPSPYQPRRLFEAEALDELAHSIKLHGVISPVTVRKKHGEYELIAGERRLRASKMAGLDTIPAIIMELTDDDAAAIALIENIQRENLSFMEEAEAYMWLIQRHKITQEELAQKVGKRQSTIANKLRLLRLSPGIKKLIEDNNLTERHARALLKLPDEAMQLKAVSIILKKGLNVNGTEDMIEELLSAGEQKPKNKQTKIFKDIRIFVNTVKQAVDMMKKAGINAGAKQNEYDDRIEYVIVIPK